MSKTYSKMFSNHQEPVTFPPGQVIFREGEAGDLMYVIESGQVDIYVKDRLMETAEGQGGVIGEMVLLSKGKRSATAIAKTECTLIPLNKKNFLFYVELAPDFSIHVMRALAERVRRLTPMLEGVQVPSRKPSSPRAI